MKGITGVRFGTVSLKEMLVIGATYLEVLNDGRAQAPLMIKTPSQSRPDQKSRQIEEPDRTID